MFAYAVRLGKPLLIDLFDDRVGQRQKAADRKIDDLRDDERRQMSGFAARKLDGIVNDSVRRRVLVHIH